MDFRIGKIIECEVNPASEKLYNEKIDIGNGEIRLIASGLQKHVKIEDMRGAICVVLCNLKAKKLAGYMSHGMVMCAETKERDVIELLMPPEGSQPGDLVRIRGYERRPPEQLNPKKNPWDNVCPLLRVDENGVAKFENAELETDKGVIRSNKITNGEIH